MTSRATVIANLMSESAGLRADVATLEQSDRQVRARLARVEKERDALLAAARDVVARWDSPKWKDLPHTGTYIDALRDSIADCDAQAINVCDKCKSPGLCRELGRACDPEPCANHRHRTIHTGDGTPVEYCAECGKNEVVGSAPVESEGGEC